MGWSAASLVIIYGLPRLTRAVPSPLVAIVAISAVVIPDEDRRADRGRHGQLPTTLPVFHLPQVPRHLGDPGHHRPVSLTLAFEWAAGEPADRQPATR